MFPGKNAQHTSHHSENEVPAPAPSIWVHNRPNRVRPDRGRQRHLANLRAALVGVDAEGFLPVVAPAS